MSKKYWTFQSLKKRPLRCFERREAITQRRGVTTKKNGILGHTVLKTSFTLY
jgi:hypothetical protein